VGTLTAARHQGGVISTTGWIILIIVLLIAFGGFGFSRRR
jgi:LPXTG-motif cell wall-anchored protein